MMGRQTGVQSQLFYLFNLEERIPESQLAHLSVIIGLESEVFGRSDANEQGWIDVKNLRRGLLKSPATKKATPRGKKTAVS